MKFCTEEELTKMSHDDRIAYYNKKRDYEDDQRKQNMQNLDADQIKALMMTYKSMRDALQMIKDTNDLYMSQIGELETAFYRLSREFVMNDEINAL